MHVLFNQGLQLNLGAVVQKLSSAASMVAAAEQSEPRRIPPSRPASDQAFPATLTLEASGKTWSRVSGASGISGGAAGSIQIISSISRFGTISPDTSIPYRHAWTRQ